MSKFAAGLAGVLLSVLMNALLVLALAGCFLLWGASTALGPAQSLKPADKALALTDLVKPQDFVGGSIELQPVRLKDAANGVLAAQGVWIKTLDMRTDTVSASTVVNLPSQAYQDLSIPLMGKVKASKGLSVKASGTLRMVYRDGNLLFSPLSASLGKIDFPQKALLMAMNYGLKHYDASSLPFSWSEKTGMASVSLSAALSALPEMMILKAMQLERGKLVIKASLDPETAEAAKGVLALDSLNTELLTKRLSSVLPPGDDLDKDLAQLKAIATAGKKTGASLVFTEGDVKITLAGAEKTADVGMEMAAGDSIKTGKGSAELQFPDGSILKLAEDSQVTVKNPAPGATELEQNAGKVRSIVTKASADSYKIGNGTSICGVRGTDFITQITGATLSLAVLEGSVRDVTGNKETLVLARQSFSPYADAAVHEMTAEETDKILKGLDVKADVKKIAHSDADLLSLLLKLYARYMALDDAGKAKTEAILRETIPADVIYKLYWFSNTVPH